MRSQVSQPRPGAPGSETLEFLARKRSAAADRTAGAYSRTLIPSAFILR